MLIQNLIKIRNHIFTFAGILLLTSQIVLANQTQSAQNSVTRGRQNAITNAVERVSDSVVGINVIQVREYRRSYYSNDDFFNLLLPFTPIRRQVKSLGSGFIIDKEGYVVTNEHVVHNAIEIKVTQTDGTQHLADIVGLDEISDIALLKIRDPKNLNPVTFDMSNDLIIGEWVIALGNPFGLFDLNAKPIVTVGVISSINQDFGKMEDRIYKEMIQTDAAINQGNSGGPLVNSLGDVIGMNTFIFTGNNNVGGGSIGLSFAIPAKRILEIVDELREYGEVNRNWGTGLVVENLKPRVARYLGLRSSEGVIVTDVIQGSAADKAGIQIYDVILEVNGERIHRQSDIFELIDNSDLRAGDTLIFKIYREGRIVTIPILLEKTK